MSDERYQQRQQRVKEKVDARVAQAQDERGIIIVFTGNGKLRCCQPWREFPVCQTAASSFSTG